MPLATTEYTSTGGNRNTQAADWDQRSGLLAFGADRNVTTWEPQAGSHSGISSLLHGHKDKVTAVKFEGDATREDQRLITGSADGEVRIWQRIDGQAPWHCNQAKVAHQGSVNVAASLAKPSVIATGGADAQIKIWRLENDGLSSIHTISLKPRYIPLALVLGDFGSESSPDHFFVAVGGTRTSIQVYAVTCEAGQFTHELQATLTGHEGWIRSLALRLFDDPERGTVLASASQDRCIRLWKFAKATTASNATLEKGSASNKPKLTAKVQTVKVPDAAFSITFEALLVGHEDWIYTAAWNPVANASQLLTASADNSLTIWEPDPSSGIWVSVTRLGEISGQKGATTATGSAGGFWMGLWSPDGQAVTCLGRTGSWRLWSYDKSAEYWVQKPGIKGHVGAINDLAWEPQGKYLLSTGADQTTRLHAKWYEGDQESWHEFARPQIHGYDLNCVTSTGPGQFVSGADEKLLRVFNEPKTLASMLARLCLIDAPTSSLMPEAASVPVLGLSNKAVDTADIEEPTENGEAEIVTNGGAIPEKLDTLQIDEPPSEDLLSRHTLWPEHEKLYGHGYEVCGVASDEDGSLIATACKASSIDHAVIRLYDTKDWHEIRPPLTTHSLTVTRLQFSPSPHKMLLSVGRDRQWTVFKQSEKEAAGWTLFKSNAKAHTRMILDAAWLPSASQTVFATAGRDKLVKIWSLENEEFVCTTTITQPSPVSAIALSIIEDHRVCLAIGEASGCISLHILDPAKLAVLTSRKLEEEVSPLQEITCLAWRPQANGKLPQLAVASADASLQILRIDSSVMN